MYSELSVITKAKDLNLYIFQITQNSPKKYRFSLVAQLQQLSMDIINCLYLANEVFVDLKLLSDIDISIKGVQRKITQTKTNAELQHLENKLLTLKLTRATKFDERIAKRMDFQFQALTHIKQLDHFSTVAREMQCILPKQHYQIAKQCRDVQNLLGAWIKKDKQRYNV